MTAFFCLLQLPRRKNEREEEKKERKSCGLRVRNPDLITMSLDNALQNIFLLFCVSFLFISFTFSLSLSPSLAFLPSFPIDVFVHIILQHLCTALSSYLGILLIFLSILHLYKSSPTSPLRTIIAKHHQHARQKSFYPVFLCLYCTIVITVSVLIFSPLYFIFFDDF